MRNYDYHHEGITDGNAALPGRSYTILRTNKPELRKLLGLEMLATKMTQEFEGGTYRLFVLVSTGGAAWLNYETIVK